MSKANKIDLLRVGVLSAMLCASGYAIAGAKTGSGASLGTNVTVGDIYLVPADGADPMVIISQETRTFIEQQIAVLPPANGAQANAAAIMVEAANLGKNLNEVAAGIVYTYPVADQPAAAAGAIAQVPYADKIRAAVMMWTAAAVGAKAGVVTSLMNNLDAAQRIRVAARIRGSAELGLLSPTEQADVEAALVAAGV